MGIISRDNVHNAKVTARVRRACIYPYMGIVSPYNVLNVKVTARVRRACIYPYMGIVSPYNVLNVKVNARVRRAYTYSDVHIWLLYTHVTMYTMLGLLRGSYTVNVYDRKYHIHIWALHSHVKNYTQCLLCGSCTWQRLSHPYMGIV